MSKSSIEGVRDIVPVTVASEDEPTIIGYTTLEILGFKVDPFRRKLEKTHPIDIYAKGVFIHSI
jgi:predicted aspartyl protease